MYEDDDIEVTAVAQELDAAQSQWVKDNLIPGKQDFSIVMTVGRNDQPSVWVHRANGTSQDNGKEVTVRSAPGLANRSSQLLKGTGSHCIVYVIGGRRIVICW